MREFSVQQSSRRALIHAPDNANSRLAVFVHGFDGGFLSTWGEFPNLLHKHADGDRVLKRWDFLFIGYRTLGLRGIASFSHIAGLIRTQIDNALGGVMPPRNGAKYRRVALLGHSLGTLGIRHLVASDADCPAEPFASIAGIGLFGSPLNGSALAHFGRWIAPIGAALRPGSDEINSLRATVSDAWKRRPWPHARVALATEDAVVGTDVSVWDGDYHPVDYLTAGHTTICKPNGLDDDPMIFLRKVLK